MSIFKYILLGFLFYTGNYCLSQQPVYKQLTTEEGLPSDEIYSIIEDQKGMIWIGCDAGLYKYDGIRFIHYNCNSQRSKSITGLTLSPNGELYCFSFNGQLFYLNNDTLKELKHQYSRISSISIDKSLNLFVSHTTGIACYSIPKKTWINFNHYQNEAFGFSSCIKNDNANNKWFLSLSSIFKIKEQSITKIPFQFPDKMEPGGYIIECFEDEVWLVCKKGSLIYKYDGQNFSEFKSKKLVDILQNRKITYLKEIEKNTLFISTYSGLIIYNTVTDDVRLLYPYLSISECIKDSDNNYWLGTLQNGLLKIPNLQFEVWNAENKSLEHDIIYKLAKGENTIFFSTIDGFIGETNLSTNELKQTPTLVRGDIEQLFYDSTDDKAYYTINNSLYFLNKNQNTKINNFFPPIKSMLRVKNKYILATSIGTFVYNSLTDKTPLLTLSNEWSRALEYNPTTATLWIATNKGLLKIKEPFNTNISSTKLYNDSQIIHVESDPQSSRTFCIHFNGIVYDIDSAGISKEIFRLPANVLGHQIEFFKNKLHIATNNGLYIYDIKEKKATHIDKLNGLSSNNIQAISITDDFIWLATRNGLQRIPNKPSVDKRLTKLYLKSVFIDNSRFTPSESFQIENNQTISFEMEACAYSSENKFHFAYRIKNSRKDWTLLPSEIQKIEIPKLPSGNNQIQIKLIDHYGRDSEKIINIAVYANPPFWQKWWFNLLIFFLILSAAFGVFRKQLNIIKKRQQKEVERIKLENELRLSQQSALKAQMNPHFIFNVLNSIKGYIYENDKKNAALYLTSFSELVRKVLEQSSLAEIKLAEELEILKLYIELESMLLHENFENSFFVDEQIDTARIKIPGLLVQPFIENAFKHGLRHKTGLKRLQIAFNLNKDKNDLIISITDNGIGRKASEKLNASKLNAHQSFATKATARRIELINSEKNNYISIKTIDLFDSKKNATGTEVTITIHLND